METLEIEVGGMRCGHCVGQVTKVLAGVGGVMVKKMTVGHATISYDAAIITPRMILSIIQKAGYEPQPLGRHQSHIGVTSLPLPSNV